MIQVKRNDITIDYCRDILDVETHHKHKIIKNDDGKLYWLPNPIVRKLVDEIGIDKLWSLFEGMGYNRNSEVVRKMYRDMGYSLFGYWEMFYWEINNNIAHEYKPNIGVVEPVIRKLSSIHYPHVILQKDLPNCPKGRIFIKDYKGDYIHSMTDEEAIEGKLQDYKFNKETIENKEWFSHLVTDPNKNK